MASSLSTALSSMEVMLDALMQRGIGKPEDQKPKEEAPPALPTRPTVRGRLPSLQRPGTAAWWVHQSLPSILPPTLEEEEDKSLVNLELERRAAMAEEEMKQKEEEMKQKEYMIAALREQVQDYESRLSECDGRMKKVEDELQKQITSLQMAQSAGGRRGGSTTTSQHRQDLSSSQSLAKGADEASTRQQRGCESTAVVVDEGRTAVNQLAMEFQRERDVLEHGVKSVDELKTLKRQFGAWKKEYEARLRKTKAELKNLSHAEKNHGHGHGQQRRCGWWRMKIPRCRFPKCCSFKLPSPKSCCFSCCFRRCC